MRTQAAKERASVKFETPPAATSSEPLRGEALHEAVSDFLNRLHRTKASPSLRKSATSTTPTPDKQAAVPSVKEEGREDEEDVEADGASRPTSLTSASTPAGLAELIYRREVRESAEAEGQFADCPNAAAAKETGSTRHPAFEPPRDESRLKSGTAQHVSRPTNGTRPLAPQRHQHAGSAASGREVEARGLGRRGEGGGELGREWEASERLLADDLSSVLEDDDFADDLGVNPEIFPSCTPRSIRGSLARVQEHPTRKELVGRLSNKLRDEVDNRLKQTLRSLDKLFDVDGVARLMLSGARDQCPAASPAAGPAQSSGSGLATSRATRLGIGTPEGFPGDEESMRVPRLPLGSLIASTAAGEGSLTPQNYSSGEGVAFRSDAGLQSPRDLADQPGSSPLHHLANASVTASGHGTLFQMMQPAVDPDGGSNHSSPSRFGGEVWTGHRRPDASPSHAVAPQGGHATVSGVAVAHCSIILQADGGVKIRSSPEPLSAALQHPSSPPSPAFAPVPEEVEVARARSQLSEAWDTFNMLQLMERDLIPGSSGDLAKEGSLSNGDGSEEAEHIGHVQGAAHRGSEALEFTGGAEVTTAMERLLQLGSVEPGLDVWPLEALQGGGADVPEGCGEGSGGVGKVLGNLR
ncbi:hypothetical protein CYMTET_44055 [Cymbomonas tetramitiformis]|uniref:Uncharacterized protein n=1 Tax=Cymbomonas tetramitiformis TaxID=36881 RepID=A0AAE0C0Z3_9CHLO|nr:hypothetical protein CYMTET_44055 [Cymbomonas tetramitiformis]